MPFETAVRLRFDRFHGFVEQYSANLSLGGMFIRSGEPPPLGTDVAVEFRLEDGFELIRGRGRVAWVREAAEGGEAGGFGLRFLELTPGSRELIFRLVERRVREGDRVFDLDDAAPPAAASRLVHDEERLGSPPWDLPAPRGGEEGGRADDGMAGGEASLYGRAAREAAEDEPAAGGAHLAVVREEESSAAGDPEVSFAGLVGGDDEDGGGGEGDGGARSGAAEEPRPADDRGDGAERLDEEGGVGAAMAAGVAGGFAADSDDLQEGAGEIGDGEAGGDSAAPAAAPWPDPQETTAHGPAGVGHAAGSRRRGRRMATIAAVLALVAVGGFLLFRAWSASQEAAASTAAPAPAAPAGAAVVEGAAAPAGPVADGAPVTDDSEPAPVPPPPVAAAPPAADGPRTIESIEWRRRGGGIDFEIVGGRPIAAGQVDHFRVGGERPRLVVTIAGIERPYERGDVAVGGPLVERVRTGFHPDGGEGGGSVHVVFDLASAGAEATVDAVGAGVRVRIEGP